MQKKRSLLSLFLLITTILIIIGFVFIYSSSSVYALEKYGIAHYFFKKQIIGFIIGLILSFIIILIPLSLLKRLVPFGYLFALGLTSITLIKNFGSAINGSARWVYLYGISFQPSELLKVAFILYFSYLLSKKKQDFTFLSFINGYLPLLSILSLTSILLLKQPDFGQTVTIAITSFILLYLADMKVKHILFTFIPAIPLAIALVLFKSYRLKRILVFLNPWADPRGAGFQIIQSLTAIGSGGLFGLGIARSNQKFFYLPMQHTDFIFAIIAEETGLFGSLILILLFILFLYIGLKIARSLKDPFAIYATLGFVILISIQAIINFFVATGLFPTKGLGLPFISYGNSALMANMIIVALIVNFVLNNQD